MPHSALCPAAAGSCRPPGDDSASDSKKGTDAVNPPQARSLRCPILTRHGLFRPVSFPAFLPFSFVHPVHPTRPPDSTKRKPPERRDGKGDAPEWHEDSAKLRQERVLQLIWLRELASCQNAGAFYLTPTGGQGWLAVSSPPCGKSRPMSPRCSSRNSSAPPARRSAILGGSGSSIRSSRYTYSSCRS